MAKRKFRPVAKKLPQHLVDAIDKRNELQKQENIITLMLKRDKAASMGSKYKGLVEFLDKKIAALNE